MFDLTAEDAKIIDCEKEPLDCVMLRIVKKEPGLEEQASGAGRGAGDGGRPMGGDNVAGGGGVFDAKAGELPEKYTDIVSTDCRCDINQLVAEKNIFVLDVQRTRGPRFNLVCPALTLLRIESCSLCVALTSWSECA